MSPKTAKSEQSVTAKLSRCFNVQTGWEKEDPVGSNKSTERWTHKNWVLIWNTYLFQGETGACYGLAAVERRQQLAWMLGGHGWFCLDMPNCNFIGYCSSADGAKLLYLCYRLLPLVARAMVNIMQWTDIMCLLCEYRSLVFSTVCKALALSVTMHLVGAGRPVGQWHIKWTNSSTVILIRYVVTVAVLTQPCCRCLLHTHTECEEIKHVILFDRVPVPGEMDWEKKKKKTSPQLTTFHKLKWVLALVLLCPWFLFYFIIER